MLIICQDILSEKKEEKREKSRMLFVTNLAWLNFQVTK